MLVNSELYKPDEKAFTYHFEGSDMFHLQEGEPICNFMAVTKRKSL